MTGQFDLREAAPDDRAAVRGLLEAAGLPVAGFDDIAVLVVAVGGAEVVGAAGLEQHGDGPDRVYLLRSVVVRSDQRGSGIGAALTRRLLQVADAAGAPVALLTETADGYFPRFGFRLAPREALPTVLSASRELQGACSVSARALLRPIASQEQASEDGIRPLEANLSK